MSSEILTDEQPREGGGFSAWQFFLLLSMLAATAAVMLSRNTHPVALLVLSGAVIAAGLVAGALYRAMSALFSPSDALKRPPTGRTRAVLERDKALVLRTIKELEFDRAMGKVSEADFEEIGGRLRARAMALIEELDRPEVSAGPKSPAGLKTGGSKDRLKCVNCATANEPDARFCKQCGAALDHARA